MGDRISDEEAAEVADALVGPPVDSHVSRAYRCSMGVGCDEYGVCYAAAHGHPELCPRGTQPEQKRGRP